MVLDPRRIRGLNHYDYIRAQVGNSFSHVGEVTLSPVAQPQGYFSKDNLCRGTRDVFVLQDTNSTCQDYESRHNIISIKVPKYIGSYFKPKM